MWVSTKGLTRGAENTIVENLHEVINRENIIFNGHCFGKFDMIIEFINTSAKVASNSVCELQKMVSEKLEKNNPQMEDPICSSLTLGAKINSQKKELSKKPVHTYTFLRPVNKSIGENLKEIVGSLDRNMEIFWNVSSYSFLLKVYGKNFQEIFSQILKFRNSTKDFFSESCTYVGLSWDESDDKCKSGIDALVFIKLKKGFGDLTLSNEDHKLWEMKKRLGWFDISLKRKEKPNTLRGLKNTILTLRQKHAEKIEATSTMLFPEEEIKI